jgi:allantoicase
VKIVVAPDKFKGSPAADQVAAAIAAGLRAELPAAVERPREHAAPGGRPGAGPRPADHSGDRAMNAANPAAQEDRIVTSDKTQWADLASRSLGAGVICANDELFADRENLIKPEDPVFQPHTFGNKGQVMDGWETRRRREPAGDGQGDSAIVRLGCPGVVRRVVVDTSYFTGNYPPEVSVEACGAEAYPAPAELAAAQWTTLVPRSAVAGDARNEFDVAVEQRFTHVRLTIFPDGGVARLRVYGEPVPDPRLLPASIDLAALENGAVVTGCSNMFYSAPSNLLMPGLARVMADGWETSRRRDDSNDWVAVRLACAGAVEVVELDTSHFVGNAPGWAALGSDGGDLVARTALQPDTRHRFAVPGGPVAGQVRLDVYPDGGLARLRVIGQPTAQARAGLADRFLRLLPEAQLAAVLRAAALAPDEAARRAEARAGLADLPTAAHERFGIPAELSIKRK